MNYSRLNRIERKSNVGNNLFQDKIEFKAFNKFSLKVVLILMIFTLGIMCVSSTAVAEDEDEDDFKDRAKNLGVAALGLFSVSIIYVFFIRHSSIQRKSCLKMINLMNGVLKFRKHF
ncbi:MAG: hypothetical protein ACTSQ1_12970 [Promethearchaeota archaeon]